MRSLANNVVVQAGLLLSSVPAAATTVLTQAHLASTQNDIVDINQERKNRILPLEESDSAVRDDWKLTDHLFIDTIKECKRPGDDRYSYQGVHPLGVELLGGLQAGAEYKGEKFAEPTLLGRMIVSTPGNPNEKIICEVKINHTTMARVNSGLKALDSDPCFLGLINGIKNSDRILKVEKLDAGAISTLQDKIANNQKEIAMMRVLSIRAALLGVTTTEKVSELPTEADMRQLYNLGDPSSHPREISRPKNEAKLQRDLSFGPVDFGVTKVGEQAIKEFTFQNITPDSTWSPGSIELKTAKFKDLIAASVESVTDKQFKVTITLDPKLDARTFRAEFFIPSQDGTGPGLPFTVIGWRK